MWFTLKLAATELDEALSSLKPLLTYGLLWRSSMAESLKEAPLIASQIHNLIRLPPGRGHDHVPLGGALTPPLRKIMIVEVLLEATVLVETAIETAIVKEAQAGVHRLLIITKTVPGVIDHRLVDRLMSITLAVDMRTPIAASIL